MIQRRQGAWLLKLIIIFSACLASATPWAAPTRHALVISSYHAGLKWTDEQIHGLEDALQASQPPIDLHIEFLDTKRIPGNATYWSKLSSLFQEKYRGMHFDIVFAQDDDALDFALQQRAPGRWLHNIPVIFSGVAGNREQALRKEPLMAGVFDDADIPANLELMRRLSPGLERVIFIHDGGRSGQAQAESTRHHAEQLSGISTEYLAGPALSDLPALLGKYDPARAALMLLTFNRDPSGATYTHEEAARLIAAAAKIPVFAKEEVSMVDGVLGGVMVTPRQQGKEAGEAALRLLNGTSTDQLGMKVGSSKAIFDYRELQRFNMDETLLPPGEIRHMPRSLRQTHPREFWLTAALIGSLSLLALQFLVLWRRSQQAREALYNSEERYRLLLRNSPVGILHYNTDLIITYINDRFAELLGAPRKQFMGFDLKAIDDKRPLAACRAAIAGNEGYYEGEYTVTLSRRTIWISMVTAPARNEHGIVVGGIGIVQDISERIEAERAVRELNEVLEQRVQDRTQALAKANEEMKLAMAQLARNERLAALGSLVAGVAHELNTPIGNAYTVASTLRERMSELIRHLTGGTLKRSVLESLVSDTQEACALIERNIERASDQIQNFKQVAVDQTSIRRRKFELARVVAELLSTLRHQLKHTNLKIISEIPDGITLDSYPGPLDQILANLVQNSILHGFAPEAAGEIRIIAHQQDDTVVIEYHDNGRGMSAEAASRAFDPFFTTRLGKGGSGLGLYITRNLAVDALGGTLTLDTAPGAGVHFRLSIPISPPVSKPAMAS